MFASRESGLRFCRAASLPQLWFDVDATTFKGRLGRVAIAAIEKLPINELLSLPAAKQDE